MHYLNIFVFIQESAKVAEVPSLDLGNTQASLSSVLVAVQVTARNGANLLNGGDVERALFALGQVR